MALSSPPVKYDCHRGTLAAEVFWLGGNFSVVQNSLHSPPNFKYIAAVFARTGLVTATWFGLTGMGLNALSERARLECHRNEESLAECRLTVKSWWSESHTDFPAGEIQAVYTRSVTPSRSSGFVRWETTIVTRQGDLKFHTDGVTRENNWVNFTHRTRKFLEEPQIRTLLVESDYGFWFKFLLSGVSGISILFGLFIIPGLLLTLKHGDNLTAQVQALHQWGEKFTAIKSFDLSKE
jgi:hypothetical protein